MTKVICSYMMCKHNESNVAGKSGACCKENIRLEYANVMINFGEEKEALDCMEFEWDRAKGRE